MRVPISVVGFIAIMVVCGLALFASDMRNDLRRLQKVDESLQQIESALAGHDVRSAKYSYFTSEELLDELHKTFAGRLRLLPTREREKRLHGIANRIDSLVTYSVNMFIGAAVRIRDGHSTDSQAIKMLCTYARELNSDTAMTLAALRFGNNLRARNVSKAKSSFEDVMLLISDGRVCDSLSIGIHSVISELYNADFQMFRSIVDVLLKTRRTPIIRPPAIKGKVLVWDGNTDSLSMSTYDLPDFLRAIPGDANLTVVLVTGGYGSIGTYYPWGIVPGHGDGEAYLDSKTIQVMWWPDRISFWPINIQGGAPPDEKTRTGDCYGLPANVLGYIFSLPFDDE